MIEIRDARKRIKGATILDEVSLTVPTGAVVGLAGVNGSGKTMLMRAVAGLIGLDAGFVAIDGRRLRRDIEFPPSIGLLIENPAFLDGRTGRENLQILASVAAAGAQMRRRRGPGGPEALGMAVEVGSPADAPRSEGPHREELDLLATRALELVGLDPDDRRKFRKYSLGMKQRLGLAAAVMGWPDVVLLDEPTNALDTEGVERFEAIMGLLRQQGCTVLLASHDASLLERHADTVCLMEGGRVAAMRPGRPEVRSGGAEPCSGRSDAVAGEPDGQRLAPAAGPCEGEAASGGEAPRQVGAPWAVEGAMGHE